MMKRIVTYLFALLLFAACAMNAEIAPNNLSENVFGFVKRNIQKNRVELFNDMKEVTKQGLIQFEVYDEAGSLIKVLKNPSDFDQSMEAVFNNSKMMIKSVSVAQMTLPYDLSVNY
ncbi:hypothetical protein [Roseivirga misakiensis]|uniref:Uncharacterized protein n=1 Tax=Roseivirga misakiensis TaxID=1563681 RepID=A0A1E5T161_9BACT|nr:hypothetical protein [Roseivirga misakiensis]OEK05095.1 hypothetical protein BFP71_16895 [Roseivirga misakiensis]